MGQAGPAGPQGAVGPSDAFASSSAPARRLRRSRTALESLGLEAGPHVVFAKVGLAQTAAHTTRIVCHLIAGDQVDRATVRLGPSPSASAVTTHLMTASDLAAPATALLRCRYYYPAATSVTASDVQMAAVKVETLTVQ